MLVTDRRPLPLLARGSGMRSSDPVSTRRRDTPARRVLEPVTEFLREEAAGGIVLLIATVAALVWANSPAREAYESLWTTKLELGLGGLAIEEDLRHWVNDALMALFFFVVGLEIKRELVTGELNDRRSAALPVLAAIGGVTVPALLFAAIVGGGEGAAGWAIPMATDIAFAVGILALLGDRASSGVKLLLLAIAIVDDIIAISVIALFYSDSIELGWLAGAIAGLAAVALMSRLGVALGLLTPARPVRGREILHTLEDRLHPLTSFGVVPLFALANAGVYLGGDTLADALSSRLAWAVAVGLVVGKLLGIGLAARGAVRAGAGSYPDGVGPRDVWGVAALGGIGFTVSLFITGLAFDSASLQAEAKVGIFAGSIASGILGAAILAGRRAPRTAA